MSSLPEEIIEENILTRLPVKSISRFRCVSKKWRFLFKSPNFIQRHLNHANLINNFNILVAKYADKSKSNLFSIDCSVLSTSSPPSSSSSSHVLEIDYPHVLEIDYPLMSQKSQPEILGSCNGLVFMKVFYRTIRCEFIWNPATREFKRVPDPFSAYTDVDGLCFTHNGFGFDCKNDDYKVLKIVTFMKRSDSEAMLYSLASNSWKKLSFIHSFLLSTARGLLHNGVLHWIAWGLDSGKVIVCFDLSDETFHEVPLPKKDSNEVKEDCFLGIWEGRLCLLCKNRMEDSDTCVWTMIDSKWIKHLKITAQITDISYRTPIQTLQNGEILLEGLPRGEEGIGLISFNPNLQRPRVLKVHGFPGMYDVETYIETLVPLNSGIYVGQ